ncbi:unnamed protein product [Allacma fusca]|uniref:Uncharacterized protein n=1 Tax=Allacma fusca TaxID=39272 RepID=A0A8J2K475_9HEXA|nr:unnamed protein product [Allacma fusca]
MSLLIPADESTIEEGYFAPQHCPKRLLNATWIIYGRRTKLNKTGKRKIYFDKWYHHPMLSPLKRKSLVRTSGIRRGDCKYVDTCPRRKLL